MERLHVFTRFIVWLHRKIVTDRIKIDTKDIVISPIQIREVEHLKMLALIAHDLDSSDKERAFKLKTALKTALGEGKYHLTS